MLVAMRLDVARGRDQDGARGKCGASFDVSLPAGDVALGLLRLKLGIDFVLDEDSVRVFALAHQNLKIALARRGLDGMCHLENLAPGTQLHGLKEMSRERCGGRELFQQEKVYVAFGHAGELD